jgi:hypothetical protein
MQAQSNSLRWAYAEKIRRTLKGKIKVSLAGIHSEFLVSENSDQAGRRFARYPKG